MWKVIILIYVLVVVGGNLVVVGGVGRAGGLQMKETGSRKQQG